MKAVIFDMDGTMIDNMMVHHRAWHKQLNSLGLNMSLEEVMEKVHGVNVEILERLFGDRFTPEERVQISWEKEEAYREIYRPDLKLISGLEAFLEELNRSDLQMAVASAAPPENVDFVMDNLQLRYLFPVILHSDSVENGKPHPEIYLKTADRLGLQPAECVVFEDSPVGATAASSAGCSVIVVTTTHDPGQFREIPGVKAFIGDFADISIDRLANLVG
ncbi:HAD family hydrolase [Flavilitoribacter nigricans]|uniref:Beta-phosphoglucomutase n=1 Tax=Flavilitoribacter nigricans (strain ATCC 23147 / DSM 23189 / NBRC 102662 / NCIMB 1420 / SS-2) TaxID=1122177 RepID=A0A2D0NE54_FLAN2|nr:HAD family phosphatase [Flavilitoribacter nigricans]PHN06765.1 beta-phosphoglucomutase [Flavilitoribacter nigricans DSM 23189 = NBRC 102662]